MGVLLQNGRSNWRPRIGPLPEEFRAPFSSLRELSKRADEHDRVVYDKAIEDLEAAFSAHAIIGEDRTLAIVSFEYVIKVKTRQPLALIILAHYGVLLHSVRNQWWSAERGRRLIKAVHKELDEVWKPTVEWPMEAVQIAGSCFDFSHSK